MHIRLHISRKILAPALLVGLCSVASAAAARDTSREEATCKDIGFKPKTMAFADCVMELIARTQGEIQATSPTTHRQTQHTPPTVTPVSLSPNEQTCTSYGFKRGSTPFSQCLMQLDDAQRQAQLQQQQYELQVQQYQQQVAAYNAQQEEIRRERNRRQGEALMRMSQGMLNSRSPTLLGGIADGFAAVNGTPPMQQPIPPSPPAIQNYTIRTPNGDQVYCSYSSASGYMNCR